MTRGRSQRTRGGLCHAARGASHIPPLGVCELHKQLASYSSQTPLVSTNRHFHRPSHNLDSHRRRTTRLWLNNHATGSFRAPSKRAHAAVHLSVLRALSSALSCWKRLVPSPSPDREAFPSMGREVHRRGKSGCGSVELAETVRSEVMRVAGERCGSGSFCESF